MKHRVSIVFLVIFASNVVASEEDTDYYYQWASTSEDVTQPSINTRFGPENKPERRAQSHHHVHKTGTVDLKPGSFITFSTKNNDSTVKIQSITNQTHHGSSMLNSFKPNVINLTLSQASQAENTTSDDNVRLLDSITFPDTVPTAKPTMTTIVITTITNSTTTITFSSDGSDGLKNTMPTTKSDMSTITTTTVITQPVPADIPPAPATRNNG